MKKAVGLLKLSAAILVAAALLVSCGTEQPAGSEAQGGTESTLTESQPGNEEYIIASEKFGFTLKAPKSWEDRVEISEGEDFSVRHKTISQNAAVQSPPVGRPVAGSGAWRAKASIAWMIFGRAWGAPRGLQPPGASGAQGFPKGMACPRSSVTRGLSM